MSTYVCTYVRTYVHARTHGRTNARALTHIVQCMYLLSMRYYVRGTMYVCACTDAASESMRMYYVHIYTVGWRGTTCLACGCVLCTCACPCVPTHTWACAPTCVGHTALSKEKREKSEEKNSAHRERSERKRVKDVGVPRVDRRFVVTRWRSGTACR